MSVRKRKWTTKAGVEKEAWAADYVDAAGKRRLKTFKLKRAAEQFAATASVEVRDGTHVADAASVTVKEGCRLWIKSTEQAGRERTTVEQYRQHTDLHIVPLIGSKKLTQLTAPAIRAFEDELIELGRSPAMVKKVLVSVGSMLADALERGLVGRNVVREMKRRRGSSDHRAEKRAKGKLKVGVDIPLPAEIRAIVGELRGESRPVLLLATFGGLRASELRGLPREGAVDFKTGKTKVFQRVDRHKAVGKPKSEAGEREVPLPPIVINALREWVVASTSESQFMFPAGDGGPLAHRTIADAFMAAQVRAKVVKAEPGPDGKPVAKYTGLHALRHFYASWCINRRADGGLELPPKMVQERLGHASFKLTMDVYGHLFPSDDDGAELTAATAFLAG